MNLTHNILMRMFGRPEGFLGRLGGIIMAGTNGACAAWAIGLLEIEPRDTVLEVGFGPGIGIALLAARTPEGHVAGIDASSEMVAQASARNRAAIAAGRVELRHGSALSLPFAAQTFDKALAINSMQLWPDAAQGLREIGRVMKPGGRVALGFTPYSGQNKAGLAEALTAAGFANADLVESKHGFCATASKPG